MLNFCGSHRLPRARVDTVDDAGARLLIDSFMARPRRSETIVLLLDHARRGVQVINVTDTHEPDAVHDVVDLAIAKSAGLADIGGVVLASVRPDGRTDLDDVERWLDLDEQLAGAGLELIEWYVFGRSVSLPRVLLGEPTRWAP